MSSKIIGFDTETRPSFYSRGKPNKVALIQLSSSTRAYLFRINKLGKCPKEISDIMGSRNILKIGFSLAGDFRCLREIGIAKVENFVDIQVFAQKKGFQKGMGLLTVYGACFERRLDKAKSITCSDWEAPYLRQRQMEYAALDAEACVQIYNYLTSAEFTPSKSRYFRENEVPCSSKACPKTKKRQKSADSKQE